MDELNLYDDLDEFQEQQEKKSRELQELEDKYKQSLKMIEDLQVEKKTLMKNIQRIEVNFQILLDTARSEIRRKNKEIEQLRKEKDDICFRRRLSQRAGKESQKQHLVDNIELRQPSPNLFKGPEATHVIDISGTEASVSSNKDSHRRENVHKGGSYKRSRSHERDNLNEHKRLKNSRYDKCYKQDREIQKDQYFDNHEASSSKRDYARNRNNKQYDKRSGKSFESPDRSDKNIRKKSSESPNRYSKRFNRSRSRERQNYKINKNAYCKIEDKYSLTTSKSPQSKRFNGHSNYDKRKKDDAITSVKYHIEGGRDLGQHAVIQDNKLLQESHSSISISKGVTNDKEEEKLIANHNTSSNHLKIKQKANNVHQEKQKKGKEENFDLNTVGSCKNSPLKDNQKDPHQVEMLIKNDTLEIKFADESNHSFVKENIQCTPQIEVIIDKNKNKKETASEEGVHVKVVKGNKSIKVNELFNLAEAPILSLNESPFKQTCNTVIQEECGKAKEFVKENKSNKHESSGITETSKLSTPRKVELFNEIFGQSSATSTLTSSSRSLLNNIKDLLGKSAPTGEISSAITSHRDYTNVSSCVAASKTVDMNASSTCVPLNNQTDMNSSVPTSKKNIGKPYVQSEIGKCSIIDKDSEKVKIVQNDITNEVEFIQIPGLDLYKGRKTKDDNFNTFDSSEIFKNIIDKNSQKLKNENLTIKDVQCSVSIIKDKLKRGEKEKQETENIKHEDSKSAFISEAGMISETEKINSDEKNRSTESLISGLSVVQNFEFDNMKKLSKATEFVVSVGDFISKKNEVIEKDIEAEKNVDILHNENNIKVPSNTVIPVQEILKSSNLADVDNLHAENSSNIESPLQRQNTSQQNETSSNASDISFNKSAKFTNSKYISKASETDTSWEITTVSENSTKSVIIKETIEINYNTSDGGIIKNEDNKISQSNNLNLSHDALSTTETKNVGNSSNSVHVNEESRSQKENTIKKYENRCEYNSNISEIGVKSADIINVSDTAQVQDVLSTTEGPLEYTVIEKRVKIPDESGDTEKDIDISHYKMIKTTCGQYSLKQEDCCKDVTKTPTTGTILENNTNTVLHVLNKKDIENAIEEKQGGVPPVDLSTQSPLKSLANVISSTSDNVFQAEISDENIPTIYNLDPLETNKDKVSEIELQHISLDMPTLICLKDSNLNKRKHLQINKNLLESSDKHEINEHIKRGSHKEMQALELDHSLILKTIPIACKASSSSGVFAKDTSEDLENNKETIKSSSSTILQNTTDLHLKEKIICSQSKSLVEETILKTLVNAETLLGIVKSKDLTDEIKTLESPNYEESTLIKSHLKECSTKGTSNISDKEKQIRESCNRTCSLIGETNTETKPIFSNNHIQAAKTLDANEKLVVLEENKDLQVEVEKVNNKSESKMTDSKNDKELQINYNKEQLFETKSCLKNSPVKLTSCSSTVYENHKIVDNVIEIKTVDNVINNQNLNISYPTVEIRQDYESPLKYKKIDNTIALDNTNLNTIEEFTIDMTANSNSKIQKQESQITSYNSKDFAMIGTSKNTKNQQEINEYKKMHISAEEKISNLLNKNEIQCNINEITFFNESTNTMKNSSTEEVENNQIHIIYKEFDSSEKKPSSKEKETKSISYDDKENRKELPNQISTEKDALVCSQQEITIGNEAATENVDEPITIVKEPVSSLNKVDSTKSNSFVENSYKDTESSFNICLPKSLNINEPHEILKKSKNIEMKTDDEKNKDIHSSVSVGETEIILLKKSPSDIKSFLISETLKIENYTPKKLQDEVYNKSTNMSMDKNSFQVISSALPDSCNVLPSISTNSPTPSNFSGIFSKKSSHLITTEEDFLKSKKKSPHFSTKPREYILPAASVLCNVDNLENATKLNKKLHWELLDNKNEMTEIEDDTDVDTTIDDRQEFEDEIKQDQKSLKQTDIKIHGETEDETVSQKKVFSNQIEVDCTLKSNDVMKKLQYIPSKVEKFKHHKDKLSKNVKAKLKVVTGLNQESLSAVLTKKQRGRPRKVENLVKVAKINIKSKQITVATMRALKKRGRKSKKPIKDTAPSINNYVGDNKLVADRKSTKENITDAIDNENKCNLNEEQNKRTLIEFATENSKRYNRENLPSDSTSSVIEHKSHKNPLDVVDNQQKTLESNSIRNVECFSKNHLNSDELATKNSINDIKQRKSLSIYKDDDKSNFEITEEKNKVEDSKLIPPNMDTIRKCEEVALTIGNSGEKILNVNDSDKKKSCENRDQNLQEESFSKSYNQATTIKSKSLKEPSSTKISTNKSDKKNVSLEEIGIKGHSSSFQIPKVNKDTNYDRGKMKENEQESEKKIIEHQCRDYKTKKDESNSSLFNKDNTCDKDNFMELESSKESYKDCNQEKIKEIVRKTENKETQNQYVCISKVPTNNHVTEEYKEDIEKVPLEDNNSHAKENLKKNKKINKETIKVSNKEKYKETKVQSNCQTQSPGSYVINFDNKTEIDKKSYSSEICNKTDTFSKFSPKKISKKTQYHKVEEVIPAKVHWKSLNLLDSSSDEEEISKSIKIETKHVRRGVAVSSRKSVNSHRKPIYRRILDSSCDENDSDKKLANTVKQSENKINEYEDQKSTKPLKQRRKSTESSSIIKDSKHFQESVENFIQDFKYPTNFIKDNRNIEIHEQDLNTEPIKSSEEFVELITHNIKSAAGDIKINSEKEPSKALGSSFLVTTPAESLQNSTSLALLSVTDNENNENVNISINTDKSTEASKKSRFGESICSNTIAIDKPKLAMKVHLKTGNESNDILETMGSTVKLKVIDNKINDEDMESTSKTVDVDESKVLLETQIDTENNLKGNFEKETTDKTNSSKVNLSTKSITMRRKSVFSETKTTNDPAIDVPNEFRNHTESLNKSETLIQTHKKSINSDNKDDFNNENNEPNTNHMEADSDSSLVLTQQNSTKIHQKYINQQSILYSSSDDNESLAKKPSVIITEEKTSSVTSVVSKTKRKRRVVKVLSTSINAENTLTSSPIQSENLIQVLTNSPSPFTSPTLGHPIFNTEISTQSSEFVASMPLTPSQQDDKKFKEIDLKLHEIFKSPQYKADYKISPDTDLSILSTSLNNSKSNNVTIEETQDINQEIDQSSTNISQLNDSNKCLNHTTKTHNSGEIKHLSLGSAEYRFEKISDNVVNLFISRKRKRKHK